MCRSLSMIRKPLRAMSHLRGIRCRPIHRYEDGRVVDDPRENHVYQAWGRHVPGILSHGHRSASSASEKEGPFSLPLEVTQGSTQSLPNLATIGAMGPGESS